MQKPVLDQTEAIEPIPRQAFVLCGAKFLLNRLLIFIIDNVGLIQYLRRHFTVNTLPALVGPGLRNTLRHT